MKNVNLIQQETGSYTGQTKSFLKPCLYRTPSKTKWKNGNSAPIMTPRAFFVRISCLPVFNVSLTLACTVLHRESFALLCKVALWLSSALYQDWQEDQVWGRMPNRLTCLYASEPCPRERCTVLLLSPQERIYPSFSIPVSVRLLLLDVHS